MVNEIERVMQRIKAGESIGALSCAEQIAVALLFNRLDWLEEPYEHPLDAINRLGGDWLRMVIDYHRRHPYRLEPCDKHDETLK